MFIPKQVYVFILKLFCLHKFAKVTEESGTDTLFGNKMVDVNN
jgi:hypothetical protein